MGDQSWPIWQLPEMLNITLGEGSVNLPPTAADVATAVTETFQNMGGGNPNSNVQLNSVAGSVVTQRVTGTGATARAG